MDKGRRDSRRKHWIMTTFWLLCRRRLKTPRKEGVFQNWANPHEFLDDIDLVIRYRCPRKAIRKLKNDVDPFVRRLINKSHAIPTHIQVHVYVLFPLAKGLWSAPLLTYHWHTVPSKVGIFSSVLIGVYHNWSTDQKVHNKSHMIDNLHSGCFCTLYSRECKK